MSRRQFLRDPIAVAGLREVTLVTEASATLTVAAPDRTTTISFLRSADDAITVIDDSGGLRRDRTAAPAAAIACAFDGLATDRAVVAVTEAIADWSERGLGLDPSRPASERLLLAGHPLLRQLVSRSTIAVGGMVPEDLSCLLRAPDLQSAAALLVGSPSAGREVARALGASLSAGQSLRLREVSLVPLAAGLESSDVVEVLAARPATSFPEATVDRASAECAGAALARLGRLQHRRMLRQLVGRTDALTVSRLIAEASASGTLDVSGIRGEDPLGWLIERARESVGLPALAESPVALLHGAGIGDGRRLRVAHRADELRYVGEAMRNCLGSYGPRAVARGRSIVVVVTPGCAPEQALEIEPGGAVLQWLGRRNSTVSDEERAPIVAAAARAGMPLLARTPVDDGEPF